MALFRKLFYRKPPDGLLEICERVYVYIKGIVSQLRDHFPDASFLAFNFREGNGRSMMADIFSDCDMTLMDYPRDYEGCPLLTMEVVHHFLRSSESWLTLGPNNLLLMHCEWGGWPVLAFSLAALLLYRKQYSGEQKTLDMIYRQSPREVLHLLSCLNPMPSQLRYLQYISRRNVVTEWPPLDRALNLDCVILRFIPDFDGMGGCRPIFRIYGQDPLLLGDRSPKLLYTTPKRSKNVRVYKQAESELVKIDINCHVQGDIVFECLSLNDDMENDVMMFRVVFNSSFIRSNILMLNRDEIDMLWDARDQFPKDFRAELLFSELDSASSVIPIDLSFLEEKDGLPLEAFAKVHEIFSQVDWLDQRADIALNMLQKLNVKVPIENYDDDNHSSSRTSPGFWDSSPNQIQEIVNSVLENSATISLSSRLKVESVSSPESSSDTDLSKTTKPQEVHKIVELTSQVNIAGQQTDAVGYSAPKHAQLTLLDDQDSSDSDSERKPQATINQNISVSSGNDSLEPKLVPPSRSLPGQPSIKTPALVPTTPVESPKSSKSIYRKDGEASLHDGGQLSLDTPAPPLVPPAPPVTGLGSSTLLHPQTPPISTPVLTGPLPPTPSKRSQSPTSFMVPSPSSLPPAPTLFLNSSQVPSAPAPAPAQPPSPPLHRVGPLEPSPPPPSQPPIPPSHRHEPSAPPPPPQTPTPPSQGLGPPEPPPPPLSSGQTSSSTTPFPPPPPAPSMPTKPSNVPFAPPPPPHSGGNGGPNTVPGPPQPPPMASSGSLSSSKGRMLHTINSKSHHSKKLKPLHWLKLTRAVQGSLWADAQKSGEASKAPEIDMSELESLFSAAAPNADQGKTALQSRRAPKVEKVQLIDHRRAYNCEIMLSKVKVPLQDLVKSILCLEDSALDIDQVDNLIKFCPTKEEMELLKGYTGDKEKLGKCEQFFYELMKVPRVEPKLRVFSFKMEFHSQVSDLQSNLNIVNSASEQIRDSAKLKRIMQTILTLGNALNQGTARGAAIGFRLDSLLKLTETRARDKNMTLMHYLCKVLADKLPEVLDFSNDLDSLEKASKIHMKFMAEEMQAINKGLEKVVQELSISENDGPISEDFRKILEEFLRSAEAKVRSLASLYSGVGRNVDALILYFGEDPARCPFEQVISTLLNFVRMFNKSNQENTKQLELEMKKSAETKKPTINAPQKDSQQLLKQQQPEVKSSDVK